MRRVLQTVVIGYFLLVTCALVWRHPMLAIALAERDSQICARKLRTLQVALMNYKRDHGLFPLRLDALYPNYLRNPQDVVCPAAAKILRYRETGYIVRAGKITTRSAYLLSYIS